MFRKLVVIAGAAEVARRYARKNPAKVNRLADQAGQFVNQHTGGRYHLQVDGVVSKVRDVTGPDATRQRP